MSRNEADKAELKVKLKHHEDVCMEIIGKLSAA
jgi:hypothetical protein